MIELDGIEYSLNTPEENCNEAVTFINNYCADKGVLNSKDEQIFIEANVTNPLYMIVYGISYLVTILQKLIYSVGASISIPHSSDSQLLNLADIANVRRRPATKTVMRVFITSNLPGADAVDCVITPELSATLTTASGEVVFHPVGDYTLAPGEGKYITMLADREGSFAISAGTITSFDEPLEGLRTFQSDASEPGRSMETIQELRERMQRRAAVGTQVDRAAEAIFQLEGVNNCNIYFNYSSIDTEYIGTGEHRLAVEPRKALVLLQGYNSKVAETYFKYLICESQQTEGAEVQYYTTRAGQSIPVYITHPATIPVFVRLMLDEDVGYAKAQAIKDAILQLDDKLIIGQKITTALIINKLREVFPTLAVISATIARDGGAYSYVCDIDQNEIALFNSEAITIEGLTTQ